MNQELKEYTFAITDVNIKPVNGSTVYTIFSGKDKFSFWSTKKDGSQTKACEQYNKFGFKPGDNVSIVYKSDPKSFTKTILFFKTVDENTPDVGKTQPSQNDGLARRLVELEKRVKMLEDKEIKTVFNGEEEINIDDVPF